MTIIKPANGVNADNINTTTNRVDKFKGTPKLNQFQSVMESKWNMNVKSIEAAQPATAKSNAGEVAMPALLKSISNTSNEEVSIHERAVALRAYRTQLLASNIANADTPNYKAVDINVHAALKTDKGLNQITPQYSNPTQGSVDGNTVEMDSERVKFAENALKYEYSLGRIKEHYKDIDELLKNLPY